MNIRWKIFFTVSQLKGLKIKNIWRSRFNDAARFFCNSVSLWTFHKRREIHSPRRIYSSNECLEVYTFKHVNSVKHFKPFTEANVSSITRGNRFRETALQWTQGKLKATATHLVFERFVDVDNAGSIVDEERERRLRAVVPVVVVSKWFQAIG